MGYLLVIELSSDVVAVLIQVLVTAGVIFGGNGFWAWLSNKKQKKDDIGAKLDELAASIQSIKTETSDLTMLYNDIKLVQATIQETSEKDREYWINSLRGIMRERLLENYKNCVAKGYYSKEERETYGAMFDCYVSEPFNGDGVIHDLEPIIKALPWEAPKSQPQSPIKVSKGGN